MPFCSPRAENHNGERACRAFHWLEFPLLAACLSSYFIINNVCLALLTRMEEEISTPILQDQFVGINNIIKVNTFASQRHVFEGKNEQFLLENASNLIHELFSTILTRKFNKIFLVKIVIQKYMHFQREIAIFFPKTRRWEAKVLSL